MDWNFPISQFLRCLTYIGMLNKNTLGVKKVRGQSEASHNGYISDQKL